MKLSFVKNASFTWEQVLSPQNVFLVAGYVFGLAFVFANPPFHSNDEDRHFYNAYLLSRCQIRPEYRESKVGGFLPQNLYAVSQQFQGIPFQNKARLNHRMLEDLKALPLDEGSEMFYDNPLYRNNPLPYIPFAIGIRIAMLVNPNPIHLLWGARIAGLVFFLAAVVFAIRLAPAHKYVLLILALSPMTLFQAASVTYDVMHLALTFLIVAFAFALAVREKRIGTAEIIAYLLATMAYNSIKPGYFLIPFLVFMVPAKKIGSPQKILVLLLCLCVASILPTLAWNGYLSSLHLPPPKPLINDFLYGTSAQASAILANPVIFARNLFLNFLIQGKEWIIGTLGRLGYSYTHLNHAVLFAHGLVLIAVSVVDSSPSARFTKYQKAIAAVIAIGVVGIISTGFFFGSPVGARLIFGLQGRYFIPVIPLVLLLNLNTLSWIALREKGKGIAAALYSGALLTYTVLFINGRFY